MIGISHSHFRWKEPSHTSQEPSGIVRVHLIKLIGLIVLSSTVFLLFLGQWYPIPVFKVLFALTAIILFIVAIYFVHAKIPPYVVFGKNSISRGINDETAEEWKYSNISHFEFSTKNVDGSNYNTIAIVTNKGDRSLILIAPEISVNVLRSFLLAKGIEEQDCPTRHCC